MDPNSVVYFGRSISYDFYTLLMNQLDRSSKHYLSRRIARNEGDVYVSVSSSSSEMGMISCLFGLSHFSGPSQPPNSH